IKNETVEEMYPLEERCIEPCEPGLQR
ncbi:hypothetical protein A2U01_0081878, partial [Trifolium medium]|nr:hypothetical protein [Trifolium medium]